VLRERLRRLEARWPGLSSQLGGRLDVQLPAFVVSLVVHGGALTALALVGYAAQTEAPKVLESRVLVDSDLPEFSSVVVEDLDRGDEPLAMVESGSTAPTLGPMLASGQPLVTLAATSSTKGGTPAAISPAVDIRRPGEIALPTAANLGQSIAIRGTGSEHVGDVEGAVDRVAVEILRKLEGGRTLVVWAFDSSLSLLVERERLAGHIESVYAHVEELDQDRLASDGGLLTAVVAFGQNRKAMTEVPTADPDAVGAAIRGVPTDTTGVESTFQTVGDIVRRWGKFKDDQGRAYRTIVIVVTDEVGDDESKLEDAIASAVSVKVPVYVLGSPALFGRVEGRMNFTDPETKQTFYNLPVRQGPESLMLEQARLPFWYDGPQYDSLDAGFGPYALSRLAGATGGIYFVTRMGPGRVSFDPDGMREYRPDWTSRSKYEADVAKHPIRQAVLAAAQIAQQRLGREPSLLFPPVDGPEFKEEMARNQALAAVTANTVDAALVPITAAAKQRDRETSRRWRAHYDLIRGRLLAVKVRCYEYNYACAQMKKDTPKFANPASNAWRLVPDEQIHYSDKAQAAGDEARALLKRVVADHPGTPWALLAQRELKDALGFKWVEVTVPPRPKPRDEPAARKKAMTKAEMKPVEPPKL